jgi:hypothetical protein
LNASTASQQISINALNSYTSSNDQKVNSLISTTGSYATTGSNTFTGNNTFNDNVYITASRELFFGNQSSIRRDLNGTTVFDTYGGYQKRNFTSGEVYLWQQANALLTIENQAGNEIHISGSATKIQDVDFIPFSASLNTRILAITGSGGTIDTGSFATTGSNTFTGNQLISKNGGEFQIIDPSNPQYGTTSIGISSASGGLIFKQSGSVLIEGSAGQTGLTFYGTGSFLRGIALSDSDFVAGATVRYDTTNDVVIIEKDGTFKPSLNIEGGLTASLEQGYVWVGNASGRTTTVATSSFGGGGTINTGSLMVTGSVAGNVLTFTKGDATTFTLTVATGSGGGGTTYENPTLNPYSGSLILVANTFTSSSFAHISASANGQVNLVFKNNNNTADTIISGSSNIFTNATAPQAGFKRYLSSANISLGGGLSQVSGSMQFSPGVNNNYLAGTLTMRGPVSSSAYNISTNNILGGVNLGSSAALNAEKLISGLTMTGNSIAGTLSIIANQTALTGSTTTANNNNINGTVTLNLSSSALTFTGNTINDTAFTLTNQFSSSSVGLGLPAANANTIAGASNSFLMTGSQLTSSINFGMALNQNFLFGNNNTLFANASNARVVGSNNYASALATGLLGQRLIVSASSNGTDAGSFGSVFVGRNNANDGIRNKTSDIVFAVGTGISSSADTRKTGFLIDSGSNTFIEGTLNVSGATSLNGNLNITGSLTASLQEGYVWVGNASGLTTTVSTSSFGSTINTGSFATTGSNSFNGNQTITGSLLVKGNTTFATQANITSNIILGLDAMINSIGATDSIAIGQSALQYASGSQQNLAFGKNALRITSGSNNFALGNESLASNTTGNQNVALGLGALSSNTTGNKNLAIGNDAGIFASGSQNIFIGASAGQNITGSNNTIIGSFTGTAGSPLNDNIILADGAGNARAQYSGSAWSFIGGINLESGSGKTTGLVTADSSGTTVSNGLVTANSMIFLTPQDLDSGGNPVDRFTVYDKTTGSFKVKTDNGAATTQFAYLIINPTA